MRASAVSLIFPIAALSGVAVVQGHPLPPDQGGDRLERRCVATIRATSNLSHGFEDRNIPFEAWVEFEVEGRGWGRTRHLARRDAEKGLTKCIKNYFTKDRSDYLLSCDAHDECAKHVNPYNDPLEDIIIEKLFKEERGCHSKQACYYAGSVDIEYVKVHSPDGGSGCVLPRGFEFEISLKNKMCPGYYDVSGCSSGYHNWC